MLANCHSADKVIGLEFLLRCHYLQSNPRDYIPTYLQSYIQQSAGLRPVANGVNTNVELIVSEVAENPGSK